MKFDSFISSPLAEDAPFKTWWRWSLILSTITISSIIIIHLRAKNTYTTYAHTCTACEKIATGITTHTKTEPLSDHYTVINEQAAAVRKHLNNKAELAILAHDLLKNTQTPVILQSVNLTPHECTIIFRCPPTYTLEKLLQKLSIDHQKNNFHITRLEQRDDALLVTVTSLAKSKDIVQK